MSQDVSNIVPLTYTLVIDTINGGDNTIQLDNILEHEFKTVNDMSVLEWKSISKNSGLVFLNNVVMIEIVKFDEKKPKTKKKSSAEHF